MSSTVAPEEPSTVSPAEQMIRMSSGHLLTQALYIVAELGIPDCLVSGPRSSVELAQASGVHAPSLYRVLRTLASLGVFLEDEDHTFQLTPLGSTLRSNVPGSVRNWAIINGSLTWRSVGELLYSVQTGQPGSERVFSMPIFEYLAQHPKEAAVFAGTMSDFHGPEAAAVAAAYSLSGVGTLVELARVVPTASSVSVLEAVPV